MRRISKVDDRLRNISWWVNATAHSPHIRAVLVATILANLLASINILLKELQAVSLSMAAVHGRSVARFRGRARFTNRVRGRAMFRNRVRFRDRARFRGRVWFRGLKNFRAAAGAEPQPMVGVLLGLVVGLGLGIDLGLGVRLSLGIGLGLGD